MTIFTKGAGTIRVVFAAKLLKKLILHILVWLVYLVLTFCWYLCPLNVDRHLAVVAFQSLMVVSSLALADDVPSGLHATDQTLRL
jgi:hypothetical protein